LQPAIWLEKCQFVSPAFQQECQLLPFACRLIVMTGVFRQSGFGIHLTSEIGFMSGIYKSDG
jgi:hypothetical protein